MNIVKIDDDLNKSLNLEKIGETIYKYNNGKLYLLDDLKENETYLKYVELKDRKVSTRAWEETRDEVYGLIVIIHEYKFRDNNNNTSGVSALFCTKTSKPKYFYLANTDDWEDDEVRHCIANFKDYFYLDYENYPDYIIAEMKEHDRKNTDELNHEIGE